MIEIVPMQRQHLDGLVKVEEECFNSGFARKTFEKEFENKIAIYLVAVKSSQVVGYIGVWNICGAADIIDVAVLKEFRRLGIGSMLISKMTKICREKDVFEINLEVRVSNLAARELYKKSGFVENGLRKKYYENTEDAILMTKKLNGEDENEDSCN